MCLANAGKWNATHQILGSKAYSVADGVGYNLDKYQANSAGTVSAPAAPVVPDAPFESPNAARGKRGTNFTTGASAALLGG